MDSFSGVSGAPDPIKPWNIPGTEAFRWSAVDCAEVPWISEVLPFTSDLCVAWRPFQFREVMHLSLIQARIGEPELWSQSNQHLQGDSGFSCTLWTSLLYLPQEFVWVWVYWHHTQLLVYRNCQPTDLLFQQHLDMHPSSAWPRVQPLSRHWVLSDLEAQSNLWISAVIIRCTFPSSGPCSYLFCSFGQLISCLVSCLLNLFPLQFLLSDISAQKFFHTFIFYPGFLNILPGSTEAPHWLRIIITGNDCPVDFHSLTLDGGVGWGATFTGQFTVKPCIQPVTGSSEVLIRSLPQGGSLGQAQYSRSPGRSVTRRYIHCWFPFSGQPQRMQGLWAKD